MILLSAVTIMAPVKTAEGQEQHPVRFVGTALEYVLKDSEYGWKVTVEDGTIPISMPVAIQTSYWILDITHECLPVQVKEDRSIG